MAESREQHSSPWPNKPCVNSALTCNCVVQLASSYSYHVPLIPPRFVVSQGSAKLELSLTFRLLPGRLRVRFPRHLRENGQALVQNEESGS